MPDITMCSRDDCPINKQCYRHEANPDDHWQSYSNFVECNLPFFERYIEHVRKPKGDVCNEY